MNTDTQAVTYLQLANELVRQVNPTVGQYTTTLKLEQEFYFAIF